MKVTVGATGVGSRVSAMWRPCRLAAVATLLVVVALVVVGNSAPAAAADAKRAKVVVGVRGAYVVVSVVARPKMRCSVVVSARKRKVNLPRLWTNRRGRVGYSWYVAANAPSGIWLFTARCSSKSATLTGTRRILIVNRGTGQGGLVEPTTVRVSTGSLDLGGRGGGTRPCRPVVAGGSGEECYPDNPYNFYTCGGKCDAGSLIGECTWYAVARRPDLAGKTTETRTPSSCRRETRRAHRPRPPRRCHRRRRRRDVRARRVRHGGEGQRPTVVVDEANQKWDHNIYKGQPYPASRFDGYIYGGPAGQNVPPMAAVAITTDQLLDPFRIVADGRGGQPIPMARSPAMRSTSETAPRDRVPWSPIPMQRLASTRSGWS